MHGYVLYILLWEYKLGRCASESEDLPTWNQEWLYLFPRVIYLQAQTEKAGRSSGSRALCCKGLDPHAWRIDPAWRMHLQFGIFSVSTSVHNWSINACGMCCPLSGKVHIKDPLLPIGTAYMATVGFL